jgi:predicted MPP superfamily phosphohydrolase
MPKFPTYPTLYNEALTVNITKLKKWGYLEPEKMFEATLYWSIDGEQIASISIITNNEKPHSYVELSYNSNGKPRKYKVQIVSIPSNLGKGKVLYFICPQTKKRCRKLYLIGGYFLHRDAFNGCMYKSQTQSKQYRELDKTLGAYFISDNLYSELYKKNFKKSYAGKPTKKYLKLMREIEKWEKSENISYSELKQAMFV